MAGVIAAHSGVDYHVYALGFTPGFPFMGEVPPELRLPRRDTPRAQVPFNAVAVANAQSCVYVLPSPGGWNLLGTALTTIYDPHRAEPFLLAPGDTVRFVPAEGEAPSLPAARELWPALPQTPALEVIKPGLLDLLVDDGRFLQAHVGMARSGPLDIPAAQQATVYAGNPPGTPLLEFTLLGPTLRALRDLTLGFAGQGMTPRIDGQPVLGRPPPDPMPGTDAVVHGRARRGTRLPGTGGRSGDVAFSGEQQRGPHRPDRAAPGTRRRAGAGRAAPASPLRFLTARHHRSPVV